MKRIIVKLVTAAIILGNCSTVGGQVRNVPLNYHPQGMYVWDTWYLQRGDTTHMFHLQVRRPGSTRPARDEGSVGHAISTDLIHWQELPVALHSGPGNIEKPYDNETLFTGSAIEHNGVIFNFYCGNTTVHFGENNPTWRQSMCLATSTDGINYIKYKNNPVIEPPLGRYYNVFEPKAAFPHHALGGVDCRDMMVIKDPGGNGWLGYIVMRRQGRQDAEHSICIVLCRSNDLYNWEVGDPVAEPNRFNCFEVPDVFEIDGKWYMIALTGDAYGQKNRWSDPDITCATIVLESRSPYGPFLEVRDNLLLASKNNKWEGFSARTVIRNGERLMLFSHTEDKPPHGRLSWPVQLLPGKRGGLSPVYWKGNDKAFANNPLLVTKIGIEGKSPEDLAMKALATLPADDSVYMFQTTLNSSSGAGITFGNNPAGTRPGFRVLLTPSSGGLGMIKLLGPDNQQLTSRYWDLKPDKKYRLRLVVVKEVIGVYIDDVLAIDYYLKDLAPGQLFLVSNGKSVFDQTVYHSSFRDSMRRARNNPEPQVRLHYRPDDGYFGDAIPFYWNGEYHVFYLKCGDGLTNWEEVRWEHISSTDLVHWKVHPTAIPVRSLTGSVIEKDGLFHAFYTGKGIDHATSRDLINWNLNPGNPIIPMDTIRYSGGAWRDPCVFWNPEEGCYWMFICAHNPSDGVHPFTGSMALAKSKDLKDWKVSPPAWSPQFSTVIECPDIFQYLDKWYLFYYWHETRIRVADSPAGPWKRPEIEAPNSFGFMSGKTMSDGIRRIEIGWLMRFDHDCAEGTWGGNMLLPREWYLLPDGTPATRCPSEIINAYSDDPTRRKGAEVFVPAKSEWQISAESMSTNPGTGCSSLAVWKNAPANYHFRAKIFFSDDASVKILLRGETGTYNTPVDNAYALEIDPVRKEIVLHEEYHWNQRISLKSMRYEFTPGKPVLIELFLDGDILEVFIDQERSLVHRLLKHPEGSLGLMVLDAGVTFEDLKIRTLPESAILPLPIPKQQN